MGLMFLLALTRWPGMMPQNFSAVYGLAFCAGAFFPRTMAWWAPLLTLAVTDALLCVYYAGEGVIGWNREMFAILLYLAPNYLAYAALILLGKWVTGKARFLVLLGGGIFGAILFYIITNTGAWMQNPEYPKTLAGWIQALTVGTPGWPHTWEFFRNTLLSGGLFTGLFAGAMKMAEAAEPEEEEDAEPAADKEPEESGA
jgi:hypothetical protein